MPERKRLQIPRCSTYCCFGKSDQIAMHGPCSTHCFHLVEYIDFSLLCFSVCTTECHTIVVLDQTSLVGVTGQQLHCNANWSYLAVANERLNTVNQRHPQLCGSSQSHSHQSTCWSCLQATTVANYVAVASPENQTMQLVQLEYPLQLTPSDTNYLCNTLFTSHKASCKYSSWHSGMFTTRMQ